MRDVALSGQLQSRPLSLWFIAVVLCAAAGQIYVTDVSAFCSVYRARFVSIGAATLFACS